MQKEDRHRTDEFYSDSTVRSHSTDQSIVSNTVRQRLSHVVHQQDTIHQVSLPVGPDDGLQTTDQYIGILTPELDTFRE